MIRATGSLDPDRAELREGLTSGRATELPVSSPVKSGSFAVSTTPTINGSGTLTSVNGRLRPIVGLQTT